MEPVTYECPPDCGLCCSELLVMAESYDVLREPRINVERPIRCKAVSLPISEASWMLAGPGKPCPFLTTGKRCGIYNSRPHVCVGFQAGSVKCSELRSDAGLPPLVAVPVAGDVLREIAAEYRENQDAGED